MKIQWFTALNSEAFVLAIFVFILIKTKTKWEINEKEAFSYD